MSMVKYNDENVRRRQLVEGSLMVHIILANNNHQKIRKNRTTITLNCQNRFTCNNNGILESVTNSQVTTLLTTYSFFITIKPNLSQSPSLLLVQSPVPFSISFVSVSNTKPLQKWRLPMEANTSNQDHSIARASLWPPTPRPSPRTRRSCSGQRSPGCRRRSASTTPSSAHLLPVLNLLRKTQLTSESSAALAGNSSLRKLWPPPTKTTSASSAP